MVPSGPRVEALWLDEAYTRARAIEAPRMAGPGVRLVWSRGSELGWRDLTATPGEFVVVGRHSQCDVVLPFDPAVALRHLLVRAVTLDDGTVATRLLDLKTGLGFYLDDDVERRALVASGPVALRVGRYALVVLPSGDPLPEARPPAEVVDAPVMPIAAPPKTTTRVTTLPPVPMLDDIARDLARPGCARVTLRRGEAWARVDVSDEELNTGVLVGRADRCERRLRRVMTDSVSRTHVLLLREHGIVVAFDVASTQGVYAAGERVRRARLPDRGATLRLAAKEPVILEWHPRDPS
jgi:hypothetical protein